MNRPVINAGVCPEDAGRRPEDAGVRPENAHSRQAKAPSAASFVAVCVSARKGQAGNIIGSGVAATPTAPRSA
jgi:hypothetical protein